MEHLPNEASVQGIRELVLSDHSGVRAKFVSAFPEQVDRLVTSLHECYRAYRRFEETAASDRRTAHVQAYVYSAFNALLTSSNLLLSGLQLPSGNLMRHYGESSAMALLCSHSQINTFAVLEDDRDKFPYHTALELVAGDKNRKLLGLEGKGWKTFRELTKFYDRFSHASIFAIASQFVFAKPGMLVILGEYDEDKKEAYEIELRRRISGARVLTDMISHIASRLPSKPPPPAI